MTVNLRRDFDELNMLLLSYFPGSDALIMFRKSKGRILAEHKDVKCAD